MFGVGSWGSVWDVIVRRLVFFEVDGVNRFGEMTWCSTIRGTFSSSSGVLWCYRFMVVFV